MNAAHIHLIVNHFPIAGIFFSLPLLAFAGWRNHEDLKRAAMLLVLFSGLIAVLTFLTGEPAEEVAEHLPGVTEQLIKAHEEAAEKTLWLVGAAAGLAMMSLGIAFRKKETPRKMIPWVGLLCLAAGGSLAWTSNLGGQIRHPEIRKQSTPVKTAQSSAPKRETD